MKQDESHDLRHLRTVAELLGLDPTGVVLPSSRQLLADQIRLHYLDWNGPERRPVLFLHGGALTAHTWDPVCLALCTECRCLSLDQRGHGDSEWSPEADYSRDAHARDIAAFADGLGFRKLVLIGQSMGGLNALTYATRHPDRVRALVVVDVGPEIEISGATRIVEFVRGPAEVDSIEELVGRAVAFNPRRHPQLLRHSLLHNLRRLPSGRLTWKYDRRIVAEDRFVERVETELEELWDEIDAITCPVLVARGAESDVLTDEQAEHFAARLPRGRWARVEEAGHNVQGDNPLGLARAIRTFLTETEVWP